MHSIDSYETHKATPKQKHNVNLLHTTLLKTWFSFYYFVCYSFLDFIRMDLQVIQFGDLILTTRLFHIRLPTRSNATTDTTSTASSIMLSSLLL